MNVILTRLARGVRHPAILGLAVLSSSPLHAAELPALSPETRQRIEPALPANLSGILFQNISIAAPSVLGEPQILWGQADARIRNLTFENLTLAESQCATQSFSKRTSSSRG